MACGPGRAIAPADLGRAAAARLWRAFLYGARSPRRRAITAIDARHAQGPWVHPALAPALVKG
jgi:hypothetical protein